MVFVTNLSMHMFHACLILRIGRSSTRSDKPRNDGEVSEVDVALTVKLQQKLKETQVAKDKLEKKVEELEASLLKHKTQQNNVADTLKVNQIYLFLWPYNSGNLGAILLFISFKKIN